MPLAFALCAVLTVLTPPNPVKDWQSRYDFIVAGMKRRDAGRLIKRLHKDYSEQANGVVIGRSDVLKQLPPRMDLLARYESKLKVASVKTIGSTTQIDLTMTYKATLAENKTKAVYISTSTLHDTWLKVGAEWQLYRSALLESKTTRNGKQVKKPGG
jgi:hypothetical protein